MQKKLADEIQRCQAALRVANDPHNTMYNDMMAFKGLETDK